MKRIMLATLLLFGGAIFFSSYAQLTENFNTRPSAGLTTEIKGFLQDHCWVLQGMDINIGSIAPIEGDGSVVSPIGAGDQTGLYTPMLQIPGNLYISFNYKFTTDVTVGHLLKIALTNFDNEIFMELDNLNVAGKSANTIYNYTSYFNDLPSGAYRVLITFKDGDHTTQISLDEFYVNVPLLYTGGCNQAPVAGNDVFNGQDDHTAHGFLTLNDYDANGESYTPYLVSNSPDGNVVINADGSFTFTPNAGFIGSSTNFTYQICDNGFGPLCSNIALVTINFPLTIPMRLVDFSASINDEREVNLRWTTTFEQGTDHFDIERSLDGVAFKKIGELKGAGNSQLRKDYTYDDRLRTSTLNKNDVYYRLRMVNQDNRAEISKVLVIRLINTLTTKTIAVTPNPARNDVNVQVQLREKSYVVMKVTDSKGTEVARKSTRGAFGLNSFTIEGTNTLTPGIYMLEVIVNSSERMITRLVKN